MHACVHGSTRCSYCRPMSPRPMKPTGRWSSGSRGSGGRASCAWTRRAAKSRACASSATSLPSASSERLPLPLAIDHAVIAVRDLDAAAARFAQLGFPLTPRGHHSFGSQNHCIMRRPTYLKLLAAPVAHPWLDYYRAFLEHAEGFAALALSTDHADASYRQLNGRGISAPPPMALTRPVDGA